LAAIVIALPNFGNILDILSQRFSFAALLYSNALPILQFCPKFKESQTKTDIISCFFTCKTQQMDE